MNKILLVGACVFVLSACGGGGVNDFDVPERCEASPTCNQPPPPPPSAAEAFTAAIQGLNLDAFYTTSIGFLVQRSPEELIWRSLDDVYPQSDVRLDSISDTYQRETFELYQIELNALRTYDRSSTTISPAPTVISVSSAAPSSCSPKYTRS